MMCIPKVITAIFGLVAAGMLMGAPARAQDRPVTVQKFDASTISRLLLDVKTTWTVEQATGGAPVYRVKAGGEMPFTVTPRACSTERGCVGLLMIAVFTRNDGRSLADLDALLNRYNDLNPNGKVYRMQDGTVILQGYINAAYGISYSNAQAQLLVFGQELGKVRKELTEFAAG